MQESRISNAMYGVCSNGMMVYVEMDVFLSEDGVVRDDPDFWLEQMADNPAVYAL